MYTFKFTYLSIFLIISGQHAVFY